MWRDGGCRTRAAGPVLAQRTQTECRLAPCLTKVWLVSSRISQPSMIILSIARFFRIFSVSLTSSCIILKEGEEIGAGMRSTQMGPNARMGRDRKGWEGMGMDGK